MSDVKRKVGDLPTRFVCQSGDKAEGGDRGVRGGLFSYSIILGQHCSLQLFIIVVLRSGRKVELLSLTCLSLIQPVSCPSDFDVLHRKLLPNKNSFKTTRIRCSKISLCVKHFFIKSFMEVMEYMEVCL